MRYIIHCRVEGGVTGTREAILKSNGVIKYFDTMDAAKVEAARLNREMNGPYATAWFTYTAMEEGA